MRRSRYIRANVCQFTTLKRAARAGDSGKRRPRDAHHTRRATKAVQVIPGKLRALNEFFICLIQSREEREVGGQAVQGAGSQLVGDPAACLSRWREILTKSRWDGFQ